MFQVNKESLIEGYTGPHLQIAGNGCPGSAPPSHTVWLSHYYKEFRWDNRIARRSSPVRGDLYSIGLQRDQTGSYCQRIRFKSIIKGLRHEIYRERM